MSSSQEFDVVVLGSGFAGSLLATALAVQVKRVAIIDSQRHPRFAIGESATPLADLVLRDLAKRYGLSELIPLSTFGSWQRELPDLRCGCKRGFSYFWHGGDQGFHPDSSHSQELLVAASDDRDVADTHWYRADVDHFLARLAFSRSVVLFESVQVNSITHRYRSSWELNIGSDSGSQSLRAGFVVDATGPAGVLISQLGVENWTNRLQTSSSAIFSHFHDVKKVGSWFQEKGYPTIDHPYPCDDAAVHHLFQDGWLWQLRFECGLTSVGFLSRNSARHEPVRPGRGPLLSTLNPVSPEDEWRNLLSVHPPLNELMQDARPADVPGRIIQTRRIQRLYSFAAGADWAALPFTAGFIDPLHSTGIAHSLLAVEQLAEILAAGDSPGREDSLRRYSSRTIQELLHIDRLVSGCYRGLDHFELFTAWTMIYFAAATTCEQRRLNGAGEESGFLCALDQGFNSLVDRLYEEISGAAVLQQIDKIRSALQPYNHVGLFTPVIPNMYSRTAADKG